MSTKIGSSCTMFSDLPPQVIIDVLSRLPTKNVIHCRCVCKTWRNLLSEPYFASLHLSRSPTTLVILESQFGPQPLKLVEIVDEPDHHALHCDPVMSFTLEHAFQHLVGSINGLLCLADLELDETICICSPIVRQYVTLPKSKFKRGYPDIVVNAFGFSSVTGEYKVLRIFQERKYQDPRWSPSCKSEGEVYALGTGTWRSIGHVPFLFTARTFGVLLNGNLHWDVNDIDGSGLICSFDIEKEKFNAMSPPKRNDRSNELVNLGVLEGCLSMSTCQNAVESDFVIWVMQDYGVKESWRKEIVIKQVLLYYEMVSPLRVLRDGGILMLWGDQMFYSYSFETETWERLLPDISFMGGSMHVPSFSPFKLLGWRMLRCSKRQLKTRSPCSYFSSIPRVPITGLHLLCQAVGLVLQRFVCCLSKYTLVTISICIYVDGNFPELCD